MLIMTCQNPIHLYNKIRKLHAYVNIQVLLMAYMPHFLKFDKHQNFADGTEFWQTERILLMVLLTIEIFFFFFSRRLIIGIMILQVGIYNEYSLGKWEMT